MNEACCSRPPIESDYKPIGHYVTLKNGMQSYKIGPNDATHGVIMLYDAFGFSQPQLLGADLVSAKLDAIVYSPDFFRGGAVESSAMSLPKEERSQVFAKWIAGPGNFDLGVKNTLEVLKDLQAEHPSVKSWGIHGYCWGGKVSALISAGHSDFKVSGAAHPGRLDPEEAKMFTIPHICLLSGEDGTDEEAKAYAKALEENGQDTVYDRFEDQVHGWMAARADLKNERVRAEYTKGYDMLNAFFEKHL